LVRSRACVTASMRTREFEFVGQISGLCAGATGRGQRRNEERRRRRTGPWASERASVVQDLPLRLESSTTSWSMMPIALQRGSAERGAQDEVVALADAGCGEIQ